MSVSDNSTVAPSRDHDGPYEMLDGHAYEEGDMPLVSYEKSPYADAEIISLHIGPDATRFDIHGTILCQSAVLAAKFDTLSFVKQHVPLPELDEATAHTLVHYLYTAKYQALHAPSRTEKSALRNYKLGTCVYCAAVRYQLPRLAELAKQKITSFGEDVNISDILDMARDHAFPLLPEDEAWYPAYLEDAIRGAMKEDPEPFRRPEFIMKVEGNSRLLQVVWKTVMSSYVVEKVKDDRMATSTAEVVREEVVGMEGQEVEGSEEASSMDVRDPEPVDEVSSIDVQDPEPLEDASFAGVQDPEPLEEASSAEVQNPEPLEEPEPAAPAYEDFPQPISEDVATIPSIPHEDFVKLEDIEPTISTPQAPEPFTDELNFKSSKTYQQMGKWPDSVYTEPERDLERPEHKRSDSVMQAEGKAQEVVDSGDGKDDVMMVKNGNGSSENVGTAKKSKKAKKKKSSIVF